MQSVSTAWKTAMAQTIVPESFIEITYNVSDPEAQADASASDNGAASVSHTSQIVNPTNKTYTKYGTLEFNSFILDGSVSLLESPTTRDTGFVSSVLSDNSGLFSPRPVITISFSQTHTLSIPGISIKWSDAFSEYASDFVVTVYNGEAIIATQNVIGNTEVLSVLNMEISSYNKIVIEVSKWCFPLRRARIEEITIGSVVVFGKSDLMGYEHSQFVDLLSAECPKAEIVFELRNETENWNPDNPAGLWQYLLERQQIRVRYGYKINGAIEWIKAGTFYISEWLTPQNGITATFTARDLLEYMQGKFATTSTTLTLYDLAVEALTLADLPTDVGESSAWIIDNSLRFITVTIPENFDYTIMEVLQLCANAACCVFYQDRNGVLHIEPLATALTDYVISRKVSYQNAEYEISKKLKSVNVNDGMGTAISSAKGETQTMNNPLIQSSAVANAVALWVKDCLENRKTLSGEYRSDPRLDALDKITVANKYATSAVVATSIKYSYNGAFKGEYQGRVMA